MRIVGYIENPDMKITVFQMDNKFSIKFETGLYEQTYKFREREDLKSLEEITKLVNANFVNNVLQNFNAMNQAKNQSLADKYPQIREDEFEEII